MKLSILSLIIHFIFTSQLAFSSDDDFVIYDIEPTCTEENGYLKTLGLKEVHTSPKKISPKKISKNNKIINRCFSEDKKKIGLHAANINRGLTYINEDVSYSCPKNIVHRATPDRQKKNNLSKSPIFRPEDYAKNRMKNYKQQEYIKILCAQTISSTKQPKLVKVKHKR